MTEKGKMEIFLFLVLTNTPMGYMIIAGKGRDKKTGKDKMTGCKRKMEEKTLTERERKQPGQENQAGKEERPCPNCSTCRKKVRDEKEYKDLIHRLNRIEGQVRGVKRMVEEDVYCVNILTQVAAITSALNSFNKVLLGNHIKTCVADDIRMGNDAAVDELVATLQKLMK